MKKIKIAVIALLVLLTGTFFVTNENVFRAEILADATIEEGVFIGGVDVSGMTKQEATDAVNAYVETLKPILITLTGPNGNVKLTLEDMGVQANSDMAVEEAITLGRSGNLIQRFKVLQDLSADKLVLDMGLTIDKQVVAQTLYNKSDKTNIKAINNGLKRQNGTFVYVEGQQGNEVDIVTSVNALEDLVASDWELAVPENTEFALTSVISNPKGTKEELAVIKDVIGTFTTNYKSSGSNRAKNVETGASKLNGTVLYPGEELSFYKLVNPFTKENGYELAGSYLNGETVESFGGGICQVSTTLYNAVLNAELEITQRFNHSMTVNYVDLAADAAIAGTYKDLRFKNNYDFPIYVEGICNNRNITFNIYGVETRDANREVSYVSETVSTNNPDTEYVVSSSAPLGSYSQTRSKHTGYVAKLWKVVKVNGVEQERTQVNKSTYRASARKVVIGTAGATPEQLAAIHAAIATKDDAQIRAAAAALAAGGIVTPPNSETTVPDNGATTPDSEATKPDNGATTPDSEATKPDNGATTPDSEATKPDNGTITPDSEATKPDNGATTPESEATKPDNGATTPDSEATKPDNGATTPDSEATKPDNGATTPDSEATKPDNGTTTPDSEVTIPDSGNSEEESSEAE